MNSKLTNFINSTGFKLILLVIFIFMGYNYFLSLNQVKRLESSIAVVEREIILAEQKKAQLLKEIEKIDDPQYIEEIARKELGLVKPGELLLIPVEEKEEEADN